MLQGFEKEIGILELILFFFKEYLKQVHCWIFLQRYDIVTCEKLISIILDNKSDQSINQSINYILVK